jgi:hypothetical protein
MPRSSDIITGAAALMNDAAQTLYTNTATLPYLNLALAELQEWYELNGIPQTNESSQIITIPVKTGKINTFLGFDTIPALPSDFIELQQLWESQTGLNQWTPVTKRDFIPHYLEDGNTISQFLIFAWERGRIALMTSNQINDLKLDYTASMFNLPIVIANINVNLPYTNIQTYLEYKTAALCAMFADENPTRAQALDSLGSVALSRALGIPIKGMQSVVTRRKPFRHSFKHRGVSY